MANEKLTPLDRLINFSKLTRQHHQNQPAIALPESSTVQFSLPKTRLTSKIFLLVKGTFTSAHAASTAFTAKRHAPYTYLKNITVEVNNGFAPYRVSGIGAYLTMITAADKGVFLSPGSTDASRDMTKLQTASAVGVSTDTVSALFELSLVTNDRDLVGLIETQNSEVNVTITIDTDSVANAFYAATAGYTIAAPDIVVYPLVENFTIPGDPAAVPNTDVIKLVHEQVLSVPGAGDFTIKLPVGTTYRRIWLDFFDAAGAYTDAEVTNIKVLMNQADTPYNYNSQILAAMNQKTYGHALPAGVYCLDYSSQGLPNFGSPRDYVDSERLTEFWIQAAVTKAGSCRVVYESLARLA